MRESKASRTLLKSPPELWSEVSTATSLQRHMHHFGEIRITKLEPETAVAWEGEHARGTITLEVSGWGTKVSLTAEPTGNGAVDATKPDAAGRAEPQPVTDRVKPKGLGKRAEPEDLGTRAEPEGSGSSVEPEPSGTSVEPGPAGAAVEPEPAMSVNAPAAAALETPDRTSSVQHHQSDAPTQRPRWTRRVAEAFRRWLSPPLEEDAVPVAHAPEPEPEHPEPKPEHPGPEAEHPGARSTGVAPEADSPSPTLPAPPAPQHESPPQIDDASTAALDATLDSLGQAHHRPFSRA